MADEQAIPDQPSEPKRSRRSTKNAPAQNAETPADAQTPSNVENAIGTMAESGVHESAGGDPNSPADAALESALLREQKLAAAIVNIAANAGEPGAIHDAQTAAEYPGERDPLADVPEEPTAPDEHAPPDLERTIEALLFAAMEPISVREIARAADSDSATIRKVIAGLKESSDKRRTPWEILEVANGFRLVTRPEFHPAIIRLKTQTSQRKLTQAALETLALIAYKQPIGRAEIESVRGVNAGPVLRLLLEKKLIQISGRGTGVGQPLLYGTTDYFLENFGLKSVNDLPKPGEFRNT